MVLHDMLTLHKNGLWATTALKSHSGDDLKVNPVSEQNINQYIWLFTFLEYQRWKSTLNHGQ